MEIDDIPFTELKISHCLRRTGYWNVDTFRENLGRYLQAGDRKDGNRFHEFIHGWVTLIVHGQVQLKHRYEINHIIDDAISQYLVDGTRSSPKQLNLNRGEAYSAMLGVWIALFPDKELS